jgi:hypothetical protein
LLSCSNLIDLINEIVITMSFLGWIFQGAAGVAIKYLGYTPGLFIVGLFAILLLWMYANFWITGTLFIVGGMVWFLLL